MKMQNGYAQYAVKTAVEQGDAKGMEMLGKRGHV